MNHWLGFDSEGVRAVSPDTGTLEDMVFIREQVALKRSTRLDESGNIPEVIKQKEVEMSDEPSLAELGARDVIEIKRRPRKPKGVAPGITVETFKNAYIDLYIPERPEGFDSVFIRVFTANDGRYLVEWDEGEHPIDALKRISPANP